MKKTTWILAATLLITACKKEKTEISNFRNLLSVTTTQQIVSSMVDNNIKTYVINGNVETITLNNDIIITRTKDPVNPDLWHIVKSYNGIKIYYNEIVKMSGTTTLVSIFYLTGEKCFSVDISQSGQLNNLFQDRNIQSSCVGNAIAVCMNSKGCFLMCTTGGWAGCIMGWAFRCAIN